MTKPMYCPLTLIDKHASYHECRPDCAWAIKDHGNYGCAITYLAAAHCAEAIKYGFIMNTRPLKDDAE